MARGSTRAGDAAAPPLRLLFAAAELAPLVQSGGLGDAVAGLARALGARGHSVSCMLPAYREALRSQACPPLRADGEARIGMPGGELRGRFFVGDLAPGVRVCFFDAPTLYDRPGLYGDASGPYPDSDQRYIAFSRAVAYRCETERPDVLVAHDWHAALALCTLRTALDRGANRGIGAVQVVHNNAYQGRFAPSAMAFTGLPGDLYHPDGLEAWGGLCLLKGGIGWADRVVAVSPSYAEEIQRAPFGEGLEGAYRFRAHRVTGIANGIDVERFDPARDPALPAPFDARRPAGKRACRAAVLREFGLETPPAGVFCVAIGRFAEQKGWDVLAEALDGIVARGACVALLGDGDPEIAESVAEAAERHPGRVALHRGFDDALARRLYAGADGVLIPSRFEPCGLVQLVAQRYGALPLAHRVGGLADTICDPGPAEGGAAPRGATGILFSPLSAAALHEAVDRLTRLSTAGALEPLQRRLMRLDVSWRRPAARWEALLGEVRREAQRRL